MRFKEKMSSRKFWLEIVIFTIAFSILSNLLAVGWSYDFDFLAYREDQFFLENDFLFVLCKLLYAFVIGFFVAFFSFKPARTEDKKLVSH